MNPCSIFVPLIVLLVETSAHAQGDEDLVSRQFPSWRTAVKTSQFQMWLDRQPSDIRKLAASKQSQDAIDLLRRYARYRLDSSSPGTVTLQCDLSGPLSLTLRVDTELSIVNGNAARVSDAYINYDTADGKITINRFSGAATASTDKFPVLASGSCRSVSSSDRRF